MLLELHELCLAGMPRAGEMAKELPQGESKRGRLALPRGDHCTPNHNAVSSTVVVHIFIVLWDYACPMVMMVWHG
jgi:hypothetical protein